MFGGVEMIPRIDKIKPLKNYMLYVVFKDGKKGFYNVLEDIEQIPQFEDLKTINGLFESVQIDESRTCVFWTDFIDLPSDAIYENLRSDVDYTEPTPAEPDEIEAFAEARADRKANGTIEHNSINWD